MTTQYRTNNIGAYLKMQREVSGLTQTQVADVMRWPHGAIGQIERGTRVPKPSTVRKYLDAVEGYGVKFGDAYGKYHRLPKHIGVADIRRWLESVPPDHVVQTPGLPSYTCVVTNYAIQQLGFEHGEVQSSATSIHNSVENEANFIEIPIDSELGMLMYNVFDPDFDINARVTASQVLAKLNER